MRKRLWEWVSARRGLSSPRLWTALTAGSFLGAVITYAFLPMLSQSAPILTLLTAPGAVTLVATWGHVNPVLAFLLVAAMRFARFVVACIAGRQGAIAAQGGRFARILCMLFPHSWARVYAFVLPSVPSGLALGYSNGSRTSWAYGGLGVLISQLVWASVFFLSDGFVDEAADAIRRLSLALTGSVALLWLAIVISLSSRRQLDRRRNGRRAEPQDLG